MSSTYLILRALRHLPLRALSAAVILFALAWLTGHQPRLHTLTDHARSAGLLWAAVVGGYWTLRWLAPAISTRRWVDRRDDASVHARGVATWTDVGQHAAQVRAKGARLRPELGRRTRGLRRPLRRFVIRPEAFSVRLARTSWLPVANHVHASCEEVTLRIGGPRSGKSGSLACHGLDAPGALLVTTSRTDLLNATRDVRAARGRVEVFNPTGLGDLESTVRWSPIAGCTDYATAMRRAADLIPLSGTSTDAARWDEQARSLLTTLLHAAALKGGTMRTVLGWISPADAIARDDILNALRRSGAGDPDGAGVTSSAVRSMVDQIRSLYQTNDRTLTSITTTLLPHLRWVNDPTIAAVADADLRDPALLDVAAFVSGGRDSLYLIGRDGGAHTLIGALTAEVAHQVRMHAERLGGRLDPPMTALLDEAALTCGPIPLHDWTADMGGRNFTLHIAVQSLAQLREVWGPDRAGAILGNTSALLVFGGIKSADDLHDLSTLTGTRLVAVDADDNRPLPVFTPAEISTLPVGRALVLRNGMRPIVGRAPMVWDREPSALVRAIRALLSLVARVVQATVTAGRTTIRTGAGAVTAALTARNATPPAVAATTAVTGTTTDRTLKIDARDVTEVDDVDEGVPLNDADAKPADREAAVLAELEELFARPDLDVDDAAQGHGATHTDSAGDDVDGRGRTDEAAEGGAA
ncbi:type IV secretory system conjugative DNA transfer family protein [Kineosporia sp. R_H_3]|uniref:type IV secretory system conjugative DNA transfer family protein n=1 Tax=Kineosporia sp. R_H_3 TaxID=1961848 RepID=UPI000B4B6C30|nr:type IV secretory system conjugative DNA transfer family protein [Kineosporia sp. R_H_3]